MKCSQIKRRISQYVDDELDPDEKKAFIAHIQECRACKEELEEIEHVHEMFASAETFEAPLGFATRVMARVEEIKEEPWLARLRRVLTSRPLFLRTVEVAFALGIVLIGMISGNIVVANRTAGNGTAKMETAVRDAFSLDLFQATPSDSIGGVYAKLSGVANER